MSTPMDISFAEWLTEQMNEREWSQARLAKESGLSRQAIGYYLGPKSKKPDEEALQKLAKAFKMPVEQVYRAAGVPLSDPMISPEIEQIVHEVERMSHEEQLEILSFIRWKNNQHPKK